MQTPTLAILAQREEEIRAFKPEPYWVVDATFEPVEEPSARVYQGRFYAGANPRLKEASEAQKIVTACEGQTGEITKLEKSERKERAPLLYDLTSLQRDASSRYGFTLRRTLAAAQRLYEEYASLTYPRTNSRFLTGDMVGQLKPIARLVGGQPEYREAAHYVQGLDVLPLGRVVNDARVSDHHAIIPTLAERHPVEKFSRRRSQDLRHGGAALSGGVSPRRGGREHARGDHRFGIRLPYYRQADPCSGLARGLRRAPGLRAHR